MASKYKLLSLSITRTRFLSLWRTRKVTLARSRGMRLYQLQSGACITMYARETH